MTNRDLSDYAVWTLLEAGCNVNEIAAFAGVSTATAYAMMAAARYAHVRVA